MLRAARQGAAAASLLLVCLRIAPALAGEPNDGEKARLAELLRAGDAAAKAKQWQACVQAYREALAIEDSPRTAGELGLCEEQLLRFADAHNHLDRAMDAAPTDPKSEPWSRYQAGMVRLRTRVGVLFISVSPPDAAVLLDGRPLGRADGRHVAVEPGTHTLAARFGGYEDVTKTIVVTAPSSPQIDLALKPLPKSPIAPTPKASSPAGPPANVPAAPSPADSVPAPFRWCLPAASPRGVLAPVACAGVAATIAAGATAIALEVDRASMSRDPSSCGPDVPSPPPRCASLHERRVQRDTAVDLTIGAGIAAVVLAGAAGIAYGFERGATSPTIAPTANIHGGGIVILGTW